MQQESRVMVIESVCEDGKAFRPSDWIERLAAMMASYGRDHRLRYADSVHPGVVDGAKCLIVMKSLMAENPMIYEQIMSFVASNHLRMREYGERDLDPTGS